MSMSMSAPVRSEGVANQVVQIYNENYLQDIPIINLFAAKQPGHQRTRMMHQKNSQALSLKCTCALFWDDITGRIGLDKSVYLLRVDPQNIFFHSSRVWGWRGF